MWGLLAPVLLFAAWLVTGTTDVFPFYWLLIGIVGAIWAALGVIYFEGMGESRPDALARSVLATAIGIGLALAAGWWIAVWIGSQMFAE